MHYVIGDIHGCFYTLEKLLDKVQKKDSEAQLIFVGDYIDRGLNSRQVLDLVIELQKQGAVCLRGNHDDVVDWIWSGESATNLQEMVSGPLSQATVASWWLHNGFFPTIRNYFDPKQPVSLDLMMRLFVQSVPQEHKDFLRGLKLFWENETHFACHAYLSPVMELPRTLTFLPESATHDMLWSRFPASHNPTMYGGLMPAGLGLDPERCTWDRIGIFGHTPVKNYGAVTPIKHGPIRLIDTGAFMDEYLTAYCCEQDDWLLQATDSRDISSS
jgi:serine/threonine protein phosphatase 1